MPTILNAGPYRVFFYMADRGERPHVHVDRDTDEAKFWLDPVALARSSGFAPAELRRIRRIVEKNRYVLLEAWDEHFGV